MKTKDLKTIYKAICYFYDIIDGEKPLVSVEDFTKEELHKIHDELRKKLYGY